MDVLAGCLVVILSSVAIYTEGADQCRCATKSSCNKYPDGSCTSCQQFWSGANCQIYNIARGDLEAVRLTQGTSNPKTALDGDRTQNVPQKCTSISDRFGTTAAWTVIFNKTHEVYRLRIYHYPGHADSLKIFEIHVNTELCVRVSRSSNPPSPLDVKCGKPLTGDSVTISIPISEFVFHTLALCEVEIYEIADAKHCIKLPFSLECGDYWYGSECDNRCNCMDVSEVCEKINGDCTSGTRETTTSTSVTSPSTTTSEDKPTATKGISTPSTSASSTTQEVTPEVPKETTPGGQPDSGITLGQIAGVVVGSLLGFAIIVAVIVVITVKLRRSRRPKVQDTTPNHVTMTSDSKAPRPPVRGPPEKPLNHAHYDKPEPLDKEHDYDYIVTYDDVDQIKHGEENHYVDLIRENSNDDSNDYLEPHGVTN